MSLDDLTLLRRHHALMRTSIIEPLLSQLQTSPTAPSSSASSSSLSSNSSHWHVDKVQPIHGDFYKGNVIRRTSGAGEGRGGDQQQRGEGEESSEQEQVGNLIVLDFEDASLGPLGWDLACMGRYCPGGGQAAVHEYLTALSTLSSMSALLPPSSSSSDTSTDASSSPSSSVSISAADTWSWDVHCARYVEMRKLQGCSWFCMMRARGMSDDETVEPRMAYWRERDRQLLMLHE